MRLAVFSGVARARRIARSMKGAIFS